MLRLGEFSQRIFFLEPEDPATFSPVEKKVRRFLGLLFRSLVSVFFAWHVFDFLFSPIWMHGYVWSLNLPIDMDLSDKSAGSIVYHQKNMVGPVERLFHAFGAVVGTFLVMLCSGFAAESSKRVWELIKMAMAFGFLVATVRSCQIKHRLFSALHEGFYSQFVMFFVGLILSIQSKEVVKKEETKTEEIQSNDKETKKNQ